MVSESRDEAGQGGTSWDETQGAQRVVASEVSVGTRRALSRQNRQGARVAAC